MADLFVALLITQYNEGTIIHVVLEKTSAEILNLLYDRKGNISLVTSTIRKFVALKMLLDEVSKERIPWIGECCLGSSQQDIVFFDFVGRNGKSVRQG